MNFSSSMLFVIVFIVAFPKYVSAQKFIHTEVFSLSTCEPSDLSLIKILGNDSSKKSFSKRLESKSNKPSVFQITGINPLRYKYYINNEAVTQFMESTPLTLSINSFINGDYLVAAPEIKVPEIFKTDSISSKVKNKIREFQRKSKELEDSTQATYFKFDELWEAIRAKEKDSTKWSSLYLSSIEYKRLYDRVNRFKNLHDKNLKEYQTYTSSLPLNNPRFGILKEYQRFNFLGIAKDATDSIKGFQHEFAVEYLGHIKRFKFIDSLLWQIEQLGYINQGSNLFKLFRDNLRYYNFTWTKPRYFDYSRPVEEGLIDNINDVKEQIVNKQFQLYEEFVLNIAMQIGVLVQNQFREYSSFNNSLESYSCIDSGSISVIENKKGQLIKIFDFIQKTNAELQILVSYLDINTELYQNIAKKINNNYVFLLSYLKNLNYVTMGNTLLYTLPTHTNLKNIDLVRYTIKREDKITKSTQTYNYDFWLKGGLKIDFSVGFFGTRLTDNVYGKVLLDTAGGVDKIRITRQDDGRVNFAFGGMVNVIPRNGASWLNVGASIGVAYSGNQKLQVLTGLSLHFGKTERLIVHAGFGFGTIKYLDIAANDFKFYNRDLKSVARDKLNEVKERDRVYMLESNDIKYSSYAIPTIEKFVMRPFIGISYNLSKKNALQAVSGTGVKTFSDNYNSSLGY